MAFGNRQHSRDAERVLIARALPHFVRRGREVYFLASRRPHLSLDEADVSLFDALDGTRTLTELAAIRADAPARIAEWQRRGLVVTLPRIDRAGAGPHVVVIEPHMDDAALSIGGVLVKKRGRERLTIVSVVGDSSFTSYSMQDRLDFSDVATVTALRSTEASIAAQMLGAETRVVGEVDALLRFTRERDQEHVPLSQLDADVRAWMRFGPTDTEIADLAQALGALLRELRPDELWVPLGAGGHVDHVRTREACLALATRGELLAPRICFYADVPHVARYPDQPIHIARAIGAHGGELRRATEDVSDVWTDKLALVSIYASQFKMGFMEPLLTRVAEEAAAGRPGARAETFYELCAAPRSIPPRRSTSTQPARIEGVREELAAWRKEPSVVSRLIVIAATPLGDEARLVAMLRDRFAGAAVDVRSDTRDTAEAHVLWIGEGEPAGLERCIVARAAADVVLALA